MLGRHQWHRPGGQTWAFGRVGVKWFVAISQISHERIVAVENVLSPGDELKVTDFCQG